MSGSTTESTPTKAGEHVSSDLEKNSISFSQIQNRYDQEREKRLRSDGLDQYINLNKSAKYKHYEDDPWLDQHPATTLSRFPALSDGAHCKHLVIGAGFGGLLQAIKLIDAGIPSMDIRILDPAGGYGGTWYWNRYPGLMCDIESYIYMPLLEEMEYIPKHKYAYGPELREYAESIADKWNLRDKTLFRARAKDMVWDEENMEWNVDIEKKDGGSVEVFNIRTKFVYMTSGLLSVPKLPDLKGIKDFKGHIFHTSRWDYTYTGGSPKDPSLTGLKDQKVGIIGTGATAIQAVPELAKWSKELYVIQRTPSAVAVRNQYATNTENWNRDIQTKKGWQKERKENFITFITAVSPPTDIVNMVDDGWTKFLACRALVGGPKWILPEKVPEEIALLHAIDLPRQQSIRDRVDQIVEDKATAEKLKPWYASWCKRPCFHDDYLPAFNQANVVLIDTNGKGVDSISEKGVVVGNREIELDLLIFSTGFQSPSTGSPAAQAGMNVVGSRNETLEEKWEENIQTLHGVISVGFPNLFFPGPKQSSVAGNHMHVLEELAMHIAYIVSEATQNGARRVAVEPSVDAADAWGMEILKRSVGFAAMGGCTPSYFNAEGESARLSAEEKMKAAKGAPWGHGFLDYLKTIREWRGKGELRGLEVTTQT